MKKAVVVLSGGLDSATCVGIAKEEGWDVYPITFLYGQRHQHEVEKARLIAQHYGIADHKIVDVQFLGDIGGSSLTNHSLDVPTSGLTDDIPNTYVPGRNLIFLSLATAYAEVIGAEVIFTGVNALDYSGYPDCRPEFIQSMNETILLATKTGVTDKKLSIQTPIIHKTKAEIVEMGMKLGVPYHLTTSCYQGMEKACGKCDSCLLRIEGFKQNQAADPIEYQMPIDWS
ncbi:7-cyano-7-deazaguanine synthase [Croceifilum oryzae]|uniref:7-cyano-7-deazaguanine synthase n=1 Tax=Croceifilum oryzae TaxID=1553429 RepID=A0AAJ1WP09_9BACL|nr:7-cyano-7-deazaguanine synthase QueC [Croceifilum oryzae]MDQ0416067.1 7-cyano-7-deazaguanine synthase [Croceifilum oryzae]